MWLKLGSLELQPRFSKQYGQAQVVYLPRIQAEDSMIDKISTSDHPGFDYGQPLAPISTNLIS